MLICQNQNLFINKVESQEKNLEILEIPAEETPDKIKIYDDFNDFQLNNFKILQQSRFCIFGFDDLQFIQDYFKSENRNPTETELKFWIRIGATIVVILLF